MMCEVERKQLSLISLMIMPNILTNILYFYAHFIFSEYCYADPFENLSIINNVLNFISILFLNKMSLCDN